MVGTLMDRHNTWQPCSSQGPNRVAGFAPILGHQGLLLDSLSCGTWRSLPVCFEKQRASDAYTLR